MANKKIILRIAQKLDVIEEDSETQLKQIYFSRVEDVLDESAMILPPFQKSFTMSPRLGRVITAKVVADSVPYVFEATLLRFISDQIPLWEISLPVSVRKVQMREYVRLNIILNTKLELLDPKFEGKVITTLSRNNSASGLLVVLPEKLPVDTKLKVFLTLQPDFIVEAEGEIVRLTSPFIETEK